MQEQNIIMSFQRPPSKDDLLALVDTILLDLPTELQGCLPEFDVDIQEFPSDLIETEMELEDSFELLAHYRDHDEKIPGVQSKESEGKPVFFLYRRPILDSWCESEDDLKALIRHIVVAELAQIRGFSEAEAEALALSYRQAYAA